MSDSTNAAVDRVRDIIAKLEAENAALRAELAELPRESSEDVLAKLTADLRARMKDDAKFIESLVGEVVALKRINDTLVDRLETDRTEREADLVKRAVDAEAVVPKLVEAIERARSIIYHKSTPARSRADLRVLRLATHPDNSASGEVRSAAATVVIEKIAPFVTDDEQDAAISAARSIEEAEKFADKQRMEAEAYARANRKRLDERAERDRAERQARQAKVSGGADALATESVVH